MGLIRRAPHHDAVTRLGTWWVDFFRDPALWWNSRCCNNVKSFQQIQHNSTTDSTSYYQECSGLSLIIRHGEERNASYFVAALKQCSKARDLEAGKKLHQDVVEAGFHTNKYVVTILVSMYSKCRSMVLAKQIFDSVIHRDVVTWTSLIVGYVENGESSVALDLFSRMECDPNSVTYVAALKACGTLAVEEQCSSEKHLCLDKGIAIHKQVKERGFASEVVVATSLVDMYSKCGSMQQAREVFDEMVFKDVVSWNSLISGYVENGKSSVALDLFSHMDSTADSFTYVAAIKACGALAKEKVSEKQFYLEKGISLHKRVWECGFHSNIVVMNSLVDMYSKCGSMQRARGVFEGMRSKDVVTWNSLLLGYVENADLSVALDLFTSMDCEASSVTYIAALKACGGLASEKESDKGYYLEKGIEIHKGVKEHGFEPNIVVATNLVEMYSKCGSMRHAREVFESMVSQDVVAWNTLILGYVENGEYAVAMDLFSSMVCEPNCVTYLAALKACGGLASETDSEKQHHFQKGVVIHKNLEEGGFGSDIIVATTLVDMYGKCGSMHHARDVFDRMVQRNAVTWTSLILGYVENGQCSEAMDLFARMDCERDSVTYVAALKACGGLATEKESEKQLCVEKAIAIHREVEDRGFNRDIVVANTLVGMYGKCSSMDQAREVFEKMSRKDVVSWNSLILGYVENGDGLAAMELHARMDCQPDCFTYAAVIKACGSLAALQAGEKIHATIGKLGFEQVRPVAIGLLDFYGKCGSMNRAEELFNNMHSPDIICWNSLLGGYSSFGDSSQVFSLVKKIQKAGLSMDAITFIFILTACSHAGLVEEGKQYLDSMTGLGIRKSVEHYNCMVDLFGRANRLEEAVSVANSMPVGADVVTWRTLLGSCRKWGNVEIGKVAFEALVQAVGTREDASAYVLMSDLYGSMS